MVAVTGVCAGLVVVWLIVRAALAVVRPATGMPAVIRLIAVGGWSPTAQAAARISRTRTSRTRITGTVTASAGGIRAGITGAASGRSGRAACGRAACGGWVAGGRNGGVRGRGGGGHAGEEVGPALFPGPGVLRACLAAEFLERRDHLLRGGGVQPPGDLGRAAQRPGDPQLPPPVLVIIFRGPLPGVGGLPQVRAQRPHLVRVHPRQEPGEQLIRGSVHVPQPPQPGPRIPLRVSPAAGRRAPPSAAIPGAGLRAGLRILSRTVRGCVRAVM